LYEVVVDKCGGCDNVCQACEGCHANLGAFASDLCGAYMFTWWECT